MNFRSGTFYMEIFSRIWNVMKLLIHNCLSAAIFLVNFTGT